MQKPPPHSRSPFLCVCVWDFSPGFLQSFFFLCTSYLMSFPPPPFRSFEYCNSGFHQFFARQYRTDQTVVRGAPPFNRELHK